MIATTAPRVEQLRQRFERAFARAHDAVLVHSGGRPGWLTPKLRVLVLTATGRRSGRPRQTTLAYLPDQDGCVVLATNFGQAFDPGWYRNPFAYPDAATIAARTTPVRDREIPVVLLQAATENPGKAAR